MEKVYELTPTSEYLILKLKGVCHHGNISGFHDDVVGKLSPPHHVIVKCEELSSISKEWFREILRINLYLKTLNKQMRFVEVSPALKSEIKLLGMDDAFKLCPSERDALVELGIASASRKSLDTEFINPFLNSTLNVLKVQASVEATAGKIYLKNPKEHLLGDVSGVIGIVSDSFTGSVVISFPEKTFLNVMSGMLGEEYTELSQDILDGAGEITNMIFGQAKLVLNQKGYGIKTALPSVITGKDHSLTSRTEGPSVVVPFESSAGKFFVVICLS